jgi:hypothetical protein
MAMIAGNQMFQKIVSNQQLLPFLGTVLPILPILPISPVCCLHRFLMACLTSVRRPIKPS